MMTFGENIRKYRMKRNLTQEELAEKIGISGQAVSKWETNDSLPDTALLPNVADTLGVSIDQLFGRETVSRDAMARCLFDYLRGGEKDKREERMHDVLQAAAYTFTEEWWEDNVYKDGVPGYYFRTDGNAILCHQSDTAMGMFSLYPNFPFAAFLEKPADGFASLFTEETAEYLELLGDRDVMRCMRELLKRKECLVETAVLLRDAGVAPEKEEEIFDKMKRFHRLLRCRKIEINGIPRRMVEYSYRNAPEWLIPMMLIAACARIATLPNGEMGLSVTQSGVRPTKAILE